MSAFAAICQGRQACLVRASLEFAIDRYADLDPEEYVRVLGRFAKSFTAYRGDEEQPENVLRLLNDFFFGEMEFTGNSENYYDPRNSYLNDVLDRRKGIPISLSVIYQYLAATAGVHLVGVNFPGHFLLALRRPTDRIYIDVFQCGEWLDWSDCLERFETTCATPLSLDEVDLVPMTDSEILLRMLRNLKGIYSRADLACCLQVQERICQLAGRDPSELRDLGILYLHQEKPILAIRAFERVLREHPHFNDRHVIESYLEKASRQAVLLN